VAIKLYYIYAIYNKNTNKFYVGRTNNHKDRWKNHRYRLRYNKHSNKYLQDSWNKHGEEAFIFIIMEELETIEDSIEMEQVYLDDYLHETYNRCSNSYGGGDYISNHPDKENIKNRISESLKKTYSSMTEEERKSKFGKKGIKNGMYGKKHTENSRKK
jgi:group I intron endonuclease